MTRNRRKNIIRRLWIEQEQKCHLCKLPILLKEATLDHIRPKSLGGRDTRNNLKVAHSLCNGIRGNDIIRNPAYYVNMSRERKNGNYQLPKNY